MRNWSSRSLALLDVIKTEWGITCNGTVSWFLTPFICSSRTWEVRCALAALAADSSKIIATLADSPTLLPRIRCLVEFNLSFIGKLTKQAG